MANARFILRCLAWPVACGGPLTGQARIHTTGTVRAGQVFRKEIGTELVLVLLRSRIPVEIPALSKFSLRMDPIISFAASPCRLTGRPG